MSPTGSRLDTWSLVRDAVTGGSGTVSKWSLAEEVGHG